MQTFDDLDYTSRSLNACIYMDNEIHKFPDFPFHISAHNCICQHFGLTMCGKVLVLTIIKKKSTENVSAIIIKLFSTFLPLSQCLSTCPRERERERERESKSNTTMLMRKKMLLEEYFQ